MSMINRRALVAAFALLAMSATAMAQTDFPSRPVSLIVPFAPGGTGDIVARIISERAASTLGQPMIVENQSGANGVIGVQQAIRAQPDGYTVLQISGANALLPLLQEGIYDLERDLLPVLSVGSVPYVFVVNAASDIHKIEDLAAVASSDRGLTYGSGGVGSLGHLGSARLASQLGLNATHIPYRGQSGAVAALLGTEVDLILATVASLAGGADLRILAATSNVRIPELPDVPTMAELGYENFEVSTWHGYLVPQNTPGAVIDRLHDALVDAVNDPSVKQRLSQAGIIVQPRNGPEMLEYMKSEMGNWRKVVEENQIKMEN